MSSAAKTAETTKTMSTKDVAKGTENIVNIHALCSTEATKSTSAIYGIGTKLVITSTFIRVAQNIICFGSLFKFFFSLLVSWVTIGVIFYGNFFVCSFNFISRRRTFYA